MATPANNQSFADWMAHYNALNKGGMPNGLGALLSQHMAGLNGYQWTPDFTADSYGQGEESSRLNANPTVAQWSNYPTNYVLDESMRDYYTPEGEFSRSELMQDNTMPLWQGLLMVGGAGLGLNALFPGMAGAGAAGAGAAAGGGLGTLEALPLMDAASLGSSLPMYEMGAGLGAAGTGAMGAAGGGGIGTLEALPLMDAGTLPAAGTPFTSSIGGSALSRMFGSGSGLLGPAATAAGALAGAQGQEQEQSATRKMDPRLDPYYFGGQGQQGLLPMAMGLLQRQNSPERLAQFDQMFNRGMGLLNTPVQQRFGPENYFRGVR